MVKFSNKVFNKFKKIVKNKKTKKNMFLNFFISEKMFLCMQELPKLHRNYSSGAIIWGSVHPTEENILLLNNIDMYNYIAVLWKITIHEQKFCYAFHICDFYIFSSVVSNCPVTGLLPGYYLLLSMSPLFIYLLCTKFKVKLPSNFLCCTAQCTVLYFFALYCTALH